MRRRSPAAGVVSIQSQEIQITEVKNVGTFSSPHDLEVMENGGRDVTAGKIPGGDMMLENLTGRDTSNQSSGPHSPITAGTRGSAEVQDCTEPGDHKDLSMIRNVVCKSQTENIHGRKRYCGQEVKMWVSGLSSPQLISLSSSHGHIRELDHISVWPKSFSLLFSKAGGWRSRFPLSFIQNILALQIIEATHKQDSTVAMQRLRATLLLSQRKMGFPSHTSPGGGPSYRKEWTMAKGRPTSNETYLSYFLFSSTLMVGNFLKSFSQRFQERSRPKEIWTSQAAVPRLWLARSLQCVLRSHLHFSGFRLRVMGTSMTLAAQGELASHKGKTSAYFSHVSSLQLWGLEPIGLTSELMSQRNSLPVSRANCGPDFHVGCEVQIATHLDEQF
ncbi:hypothetical protein P7K49_014005 [Saguinus oedipus]|uniref:Uncharacterized protein n=1 Tax=Saguinus oedipus TaxID=9490 RepID=A0ABQ9VID5_SAGOE|nr:hypothetical protein P7K49_014005 [Saguinus oedipus]